MALDGVVTSSGWKYIEYDESAERELYDLDSDPFELDNLPAIPVGKPPSSGWPTA